MCGRFAFFHPEAVFEIFRLQDFRIELSVRYNIAPSQIVPVVRQDEKGDAKLSHLHWGLIPSWSREPKTKYSTINARIETLKQKPMFKNLLTSHKCIIPTNGYYEWQQVNGVKRPMLISMPEMKLFGMAGLWDEWHDKKTGEVIESFTIITLPSEGVVKDIHPRMPAVVMPDKLKEWFSVKPESMQTFLKKSPYEQLEAYEISKLVNNPKNDVPECIEPV